MPWTGPITWWNRRASPAARAEDLTRHALKDSRWTALIAEVKYENGEKLLRLASAAR